MQNLEPHNLIGASPLFAQMQPHEVETILERLRPSFYARGTRILEQGVWHGTLYIIASGLVNVLLKDESREQEKTEDYVVARLGPGECFGEMSLITGEPPGATVHAEEDVTLWSLTQADFHTLMSSCPTLLRNINTILSQRLARMNQQFIATPIAEVCLLTLIDTPGAPPERELAYHIASALADCSRKRILLLELCGADQAAAAHFAAQLRPALLTCAREHARLQAHHAAGAQSIPALAALTDTQEQALSVDADLLASLAELTPLYEYILLVATARTPVHIMEALLNDKRAQPYTPRQKIALVAGGALSAVQTNALLIGPAEHSAPPAVFIVHEEGKPTIAEQERYTRHLGYEVTRLLPADNGLLAESWREKRALAQHAPQAALNKAVDFVARYIAQQTVGIAFGGGGARGFAHLGVLDSLLEHGVPLDYIAACSSGIIASGMYLVGKSITESEEIFLDIQRNIAYWRFPRTSLFSNRGIKRMLRQICGDLRFEDLTTPFAMVAVDLTTQAGVVLERGPIWQAALASVALPGIFPPVMIGEHVLMDAGLHDPVPVRLARRMGAHILLAVELGGHEPPAFTSATPWLEEAANMRTSLSRDASRSPHIVDLLLRSYELTMATIGMHSIREADVVIRPELHHVSLRQFSQGRKFVQAGRDAVEQALPQLRERLPWLPPEKL